MKLTRNFETKVMAWGMTLVLATCAATLPAQTPTQGTGKVIRIKGAARYTTGDNKWHPLSEGDLVRPGTVIQTASSSQLDLLLSDREMVMEKQIPPVLVYRPESDARINMVRLFENTVLAVDKLMSTETGADAVSEIQLDLRAGRVFGTVKKQTGASRYEVKLPNGVAGVRGTIYTLNADGLVKVLVGTVVISWAKPDGTIVTQVVRGGQMFDPVTGLLTNIPNFDQKEMVKAAKESGIGPNTPPSSFTVDNTIYYVSPTIGFNGNRGVSEPPGSSPE